MKRDHVSTAQVHRFHDHVAVYISDDKGGKTVYFTPEEARKLGLAIHRTALDTTRTDFLDSSIGTFWLNIDPGGES